MIAQNPEAVVAKLPEELPPSPIRFDYLDGMRGTAALYVVFYHALMAGIYPSNGSWFPPEFPRWMVTAAQPLRYGHFAVVVFIALSGYCLTLPVARKTAPYVAKDLWHFFLRRARRILPPYYAALALVILIDTSVPEIGHAHDWFWKITMPATSAPMLLSHLFLVHNLNPEWFSGIDYPTWSVATEWQIYGLFAAVLLPLWRRVGPYVTLILALAFGLIIHRLFDWRFDGACPQFVGVFTLGMAAAFWTQLPPSWFLRTPWNAISVISTGIVIAMVVLRPIWWRQHTFLVDPLIGVAAVSLIILCRKNIEQVPAQPSFLLTLLQSSWAVRLGAFSYSLYLMHAPVLGVLQLWLRHMNYPVALQFGVLLFIGTPLSLVVSYVFHIAFERPFMPGRPKTDRQAEFAAIASPAP